MEDTKLLQYLRKKHAPATVYDYYRTIQIYLREQPKAAKASYKDVLNYMGILRKRYNNGNSVKATLNGIKKYYDYLVATNQRIDHPCRTLNVKDKLHKDVQLQDLLNEDELEALLNYKAKQLKPFLSIRNKALLSLLIYQGVTRRELKKLSVSDVNLETGSIYIKSGINSNRRTLELKSTQILLFHNYINEVRPALLRRNPLRIKTDCLFITIQGKPEHGDSLKYIFNQMQQEDYPHLKHIKQKRITIQLIRQSVIALKLKKGNDVRLVQHFAGHKNTSSTERYKAVNIEELKAGVSKYHPLK